MSRPATVGMLKREGTPTWLFETLHRLIEGQNQSIASFGSITRGEVPDGSGSSLVDTSLFFYKPGLPKGQVAFGDTLASGTLTLSSTSNLTKGLIFLGSAATSMFDEANQRVGLNTTPLFRLHQKHAAVETMQRWEGPPSISVANVTANGTTTLTSSGGFTNVYQGMLVFGTGVPANTVVTAWVSGSQITVSNAVTAGTITATFAHVGDMAFVTNGAIYDLLLKTSSAFQIVGSSASPGAQGSGTRFAVQTAIGTVIRSFIEAGPTNQNFAITGFNGGDGNSIHTLFTYAAFDNWNGTALQHNTRVGINEDPFDYSGSATGSQPDALQIQRRASAASGVPTVIINGSGTEAALGITAGGTGTAPNRTIGAQLFAIRNDGKLRWGASANGLTLNGATGGSGSFVGTNNNSRTIFDWRSGVAAFADAVASCALFTSNTTDDTFNFLMAGDGGNILARVGVCATSMVLGPRTSGALPAPVSSRLLTLVNSSGTVLSGFSSAGAMFLVAGAGLGKAYVSDAAGGGSWSTGVAATDANVVVDGISGDVLTSDGNLVIST